MSEKSILDAPDPVHTLAEALIARGDKPRNIGGSMLSDAIGMLMRAGLSKEDIIARVNAIYRALKDPAA